MLAIIFVSVAVIKNNVANLKCCGNFRCLFFIYKYTLLWFAEDKQWVANNVLELDSSRVVISVSVWPQSLINETLGGEFLHFLGVPWRQQHSRRFFCIFLILFVVWVFFCWEGDGD